jgi:oxaloacetate decarboxylase beta subunit
MGMLMPSNFVKVNGVVPRLTRASEHEIANVATLFLGLVAIVVDTGGGLLLGKDWGLLSGGKVNPRLGAAGISAYPMAARLVQPEGQRWNWYKFLLMPAMAAAILLAGLKGMGLR